MAIRAVLPALVLLLASCGTSPASSSPTIVPTQADPPSPTGGSVTPAASPEADPTPSATPEPLAWAELASDGPAAREDHTWTVDEEGRIAYLFGGRDGATVFGDLWAYDLNADAWTELNPGAGPAPRFGHEAVWVAGTGLVLFAGQAGPTFFNDLWAFDPGDGGWEQLPAGGATPVPRYGSCAAIGPDGRLWISHGFTADGTRFSDTRAYDFASGSWTDETPTEGRRPVERCLHGCWWTDGGELALYGGQTTGATAIGDRWRLAKAAWMRVEGEVPPDRNLYARTRLAGATLVFGGQGVDGGFLDDLWVLADDADDATRLDAPAGPAPRAGAELVRDGDRVLLFGGRNADGALDDLWVLDGLQDSE